MEGVLLVNKPILYTSHDVVDVIRKKIGIDSSNVNLSVYVKTL